MRRGALPLLVLLAGVDFGWPDRVTVVSQMIGSARSRPTAAWAGFSAFRIVISAPNGLPGGHG
jgi:hypothetical protein